MEDEVLKATCTYCGKEIFSLYEKQLKYNMDMHETNCPQGQKDKRDGVKVGEE